MLGQKPDPFPGEVDIFGLKCFLKVLSLELKSVRGKVFPVKDEGKEKSRSEKVEGESHG